MWNGETFLVCGCGPSLSLEEVAKHSAKARVIAVNRAIEFIPNADVAFVYHGDLWPEACRAFKGLKYTINRKCERHGFILLNCSGSAGIEHLSRDSIRSGCNSGYAAMNLAILLGAKRIGLMGMDCGKSPEGKRHFYDIEEPKMESLNPAYDLWLTAWGSAVKELHALNIEVVNLSPTSRIDCFPKMTIEEFFT